MKLPDLIKKAVQTEDWLLICKAYTAITGEPLSPPEKKSFDFSNFEVPDEVLKFNEEDEDEDEYDDPQEADEEAPEDEDEDEPTVKTSSIVTDLDEAKAEFARSKKKDSSFIAPAKKTSRTGSVENEEGKREAKRESMRIPRQGDRKNKFTDDVSKEKDKN